MSPVTIVVAAARNGVIGAGAEIPWRIPGEQRHFKELTMGGALVLGRKTFDSIGRPLPGRQSVVVTRDAKWRHEGVLTAPDPLAGLAAARATGRPVFVVGGGEIYRALLPHTDRIELTVVDAEPEGDVHFDPGPGWREVAREDHPGHSYRTLLRSREEA